MPFINPSVKEIIINIYPRNQFQQQPVHLQNIGRTSDRKVTGQSNRNRNIKHLYLTSDKTSPSLSLSKSKAVTALPGFKFQLDNNEK